MAPRPMARPMARPTPTHMGVQPGGAACTKLSQGVVSHRPGLQDPQDAFLAPTLLVLIEAGQRVQEGACA